MNIYVGNLSYDCGETQLRELFSYFGEVDSLKIIKDRNTGRPKGFAFVEMVSERRALDAISALNGADYLGRPLKVNEAKPSNGKAD